ncbi:Uncharacterised protein [Mycobacterium tuberculosis]|uniref:Uncharacterized protein n=1 Tax=Mycobacterium tuberculosis TaxID=1773 RepID=A0A655DPS4_MYCTX|nr:Uncharacterised protein [Mycobacterium tuberculosis]CKO28707.1 Uncharacterised protein [Mycobacterium tuberculosis]CKP50001.1 Uncharacterised protein [Mycobacterium tuberculosis]CKR44512.1 Uncharacterised protein [Mycobacterium tuberculosis]CKS39346.1 Uncharacterised protein [Mycobacterium tuberculosis]
MPNIETVDVTNTDMVVCIDNTNTRPMVMTTVQTASASGIAAAANEPKTATRTIRMIGRFQRSALAISCLVFAAAAADSAPCPMT